MAPADPFFHGLLEVFGDFILEISTKMTLFCQNLGTPPGKIEKLAKKRQNRPFFEPFLKGRVGN